MILLVILLAQGFSEKPKLVLLRLFLTSFFTGKKKISGLFLLVPSVEFWEIYDKKKKKVEIFFYMVKKTAKVSLVILSALVLCKVPRQLQVHTKLKSEPALEPALEPKLFKSDLELKQIVSLPHHCAHYLPSGPQCKQQRWARATFFFESATAILQLKGNTSAIAIPQLFKETVASV